MSHLSRRRFLEDSMFAAAAAAAAGSARPLFAEQEKQSTSPNEKLCHRHHRRQRPRQLPISANSPDRKDVDLVAICDVDPSVGNRRCDEIERKTGRRPKFVQDIRKVFDDKSIDCISIATPNHWHALAAIWAMQAGKDVYVEKPVSHNVSEGRRIVEAARKHGRICQTGTQCRSMQGSIDAIEFVQAGKIGEVKLARGLCYKRRDGDQGIVPSVKQMDPSQTVSTTTSGAAPPPSGRTTKTWSTTTGTGSGTTATATWATRAFTRWTSPAGAWASIPSARRCSATAAASATSTHGETANTQVIIHDYGTRRWSSRSAA